MSNTISMVATATLAASKIAKTIVEKNNESVVSEDDKTTSLLIKYLIDKSDLNYDLLAQYLGCKAQSLRNKFSRDSFSIDDLLITAFACRYDVMLKSKIDDDEFKIDIAEFFKPMKDEVLVRINDLEKERNQLYDDKITKLKLQLQRLEAEKDALSK